MARIAVLRMGKMGCDKWAKWACETHASGYNSASSLKNGAPGSPKMEK